MEFFRKDIIEWLLEPSNPSVRFWALQQLQDKPLTHPEVQAAQKAINKSAIVKAILGAQSPEGHWGNPDNNYLKKYTATTHSLLILAELGAERSPAIEKGINHMFEFQVNSGHFLTNRPKTKRGLASKVSDMCCFDGNILYYLVYFGYLEDARVKRLIDFLVNHHDNKAGGWLCRAYPINPEGVFPTNCYMGMYRIFRAFSIIPDRHRSPIINRIIGKAVEVMLENGIYKYLRAPDGQRKEKAGWKRFGFPLFYNADVLEVLDTLTRLNIHDNRMQDSIDLVVSNRRPDGKWLLQHSFNDSMWHDIEVKGQPSKWITLRALRVLRRYYGK
ncbi:MAG: hypothetical protein ACFFDP_00195 [Promethearchaeota archaeon]